MHVFQSIKQPDVLGFTGDQFGAKLPAELGPWVPSASDPLEDGAPVGATKRVMAAVARDGFYVVRSEVLSRDTGIPWVGK